MKIGGFQKNSLLDYPGKIAAIIFTQGCNFRCEYCHNSQLFPLTNASSFDEAFILDFLKSRQGLLDGVVVSGGEPCLQKDIANFLQEIKFLRFYVKLDTNGSFPDVLESLLTQGLLDYIAMDVKAPVEKYQHISCSKIPTKNILKSIELIKNSGLDYEFRTTVVKSQLTFDDFEKMGKMILGAKKYYLQKFVVPPNFEGKFSSNDTYNNEEFEIIAQNLRKYVLEVDTR